MRCSERTGSHEAGSLSSAQDGIGVLVETRGPYSGSLAACREPDRQRWLLHAGGAKRKFPRPAGKEPRAGGRGPELVGLGDMGVTVGACLLWSAEARRQKALTVFLSPRGSRGADVEGESIGFSLWVR